MLAQWEFFWTSAYGTTSPWRTTVPPTDLFQRILNIEQQNQANADTVLGPNNTILVKNGAYMISDALAASLSLALPLPGSAASGGDDGKILRLIATTAFAHVVTVAQPNGINGNRRTMTWTAGAGNSIELVAFNGTWWTGFISGVTLS